MNDNFKKLLIEQKSASNIRSNLTASCKNKQIRKMSTGVKFSQIINEKAQNKQSNLSLNNFSLSKDQREQILSLQDQLVQFKTYYNSKEREFHTMKINYLKLEEENKKNLRIIEKILSNVNLNRQVEEHPDDKKLIGDIDSLKETFVISSLKYEITKLKRQLDEKDKEIEELKKQDKISRYISIKNEYKKMCDDYKLLDYTNNDLKIKYDNLLNQNNSIIEENTNTKENLKRIRILYEDIKKMLKFYQDETAVNYYEQKEMKDKLYFSKYSHKYLQNKIKTIEQEKANIMKSNDEIEDFKKKREHYEMSIAELTKKYNFAIFEKEQLIKKIKQKEKENEFVQLNKIKIKKTGSKSIMRKLTGQTTVQENEYLISKSSLM